MNQTLRFILHPSAFILPERCLMTRGSIALLALTAVLIASAEPTTRDVEALLRQAQTALARNDFAAALAQYEQAEERCDDPGFVAYNKGLLFYRWALAG